MAASRIFGSSVALLLVQAGACSNDSAEGVPALEEAETSEVVDDIRAASTVLMDVYQETGGHYSIEANHLLGRSIVGINESRVFKVYGPRRPADGGASPDMSLTWVAEVPGIVEFTSARATGGAARVSIRGAMYGRTWVLGCDHTETTCHAIDISVEDVVPPVLQGQIRAVPLSNTEVEVTWPAGSDDVSPADELSYKVCFSRGFGAGPCGRSDTVMRKTSAGVTTMTFGGLLEGERYGFDVWVGDGEGNWTERPMSGNVRTPTQRSVTSIVADGDRTCALLSDGGAKCWGSYVPGWPGTCGARSGSSVYEWLCATYPVLVQELRGVVMLSAGFFPCGLFVDGSLICLETHRDSYRQVRTESVRIEGVSRVAALSGTCAVTDAGEGYCWYGGDPRTLGPAVKRDGLVGVIRLCSGATSANGCAVRVGGFVYCWGRNWAGQLGDGSTSDSDVPVMVSGLSGAQEIACGESHSCALLRDGSVWCWGENASGQLGVSPEQEEQCVLKGWQDQSRPCRKSAVKVPDLPDSTSVSAGTSHTCALTSSAEVWCWGDHSVGQLGIGAKPSVAAYPKTHANYPPSRVPGIAGAVQVSLGAEHSCAMLQDGSVRCWGSHSDGQLGHGEVTGRDEEKGYGKYKYTETNPTEEYEPVGVIELP